MLEIQRFGLEKIYCAPSQDSQYCFKLANVTKAGYPVKRSTQVYKDVKRLPDTTNYYHVYVIGNVSPGILNLKQQTHEWYRDQWVNVAQDMQERNYILQFYNDQGVNFPRPYIYYSFIDEGSMVIAVQVNESLKRSFDIDSFRYLRIYANTYFRTLAFNNQTNKQGILHAMSLVGNNTDKVALQTKIATWEAQGGKTIVYVNGYHTDNLNLNIPNNSYVELVYDQSIIYKEKHRISDLRTFESTKDNKLKYLLYRDVNNQHIQYDDDCEFYVSTDNELVTKGLMFYSHQDYAVRNVTDKDYSLYTSFVNTQASILSTLTSGSIGDKVLVLYSRQSGLSRPLVYSSLKLHELYKLPREVQRDVLSNTNHPLTEMRAEKLEDSAYFQLASVSRPSGVTKELATQAVGYSGVAYYYGQTPASLTGPQPTVDVPYLYRQSSYAYEYDVNGLLIDRHVTEGPLYSVASPQTRHVEYIQGVMPPPGGKLYLPGETMTRRDAEYRVLSAFFDGVSRISNWEDITDTSKVVSSGLSLTFNETDGRKVRVHYLDEPMLYDLELDINDPVFGFPLSVQEDRGLGVRDHLLDVPYMSIEVFLNRKRLTYQVDWFLDFPYVVICNKSYLDQTKSLQDVHVRCHGYVASKELINSQEIRGFVNNGVLTRNNYYDLRDDKVFTTYIGGKVYNRSQVVFSEDDNTVRLSHPLNGLPYTLAEPLISIKGVTGMDTLPTHRESKELDTKISQLFNVIFPEPAINPFNVISGHHYLYSPLVQQVIMDMKSGVLPASVYTQPYNDTTILQMLDTTYKQVYMLDPIRADLPVNVTEIHPTRHTAVESVNLYQYRFLTNLVRIITRGNPERINLSGYLSVSAETTDVPTTPSTPGGITYLT